MLRLRIANLATGFVSVAGVGCASAAPPRTAPTLEDSTWSRPRQITPTPATTRLGARVLRVDRFPYSVVFLDLESQVRILAFAHGRRRPGYWRRRAGPPEST